MTVRNRYVLAADIPLVAAAAFGAFVLRFDWFAERYRPELVPFVLAAVLLKPLVFSLFGLYQRYWAYASVSDMLAVFFATSGASVAVVAAVVLGVLTRQISEFSRSVLLIDWVLTMLMIGGLRMSIRVQSEARLTSRSGKPPAHATRRVLVIGAGHAGGMVVREMQKNPHLGMLPVGFLDDDRAKIGKRIYDVPVLGDVPRLGDTVRTRGVEDVVIAMPKAPGSVLRGIAEDCQRHGVSSRTVPGIFELLDGKVSVSALRHVEITDLLRRSAIARTPGMSQYLAGRTVLVTGAGGSIGLELCRQVAHAGPSTLVLLGHGENSIYEAHAQLARSFPSVRLTPVIGDVRDLVRLRGVFDRCRPDVVFHAAAHKHVPLLEGNPEEAVTNNIVGTKNVVDVSLAKGVQKFVFVSTDKAVSPTSIMGASKRMAEDVVRHAAVRHNRPFMVVRFGNVLGSRGSVVPLFKQQIERGGPITITHPDMKRFFMTIPEAVDLVLHAGGLGKGGELFVLNMGLPVRIADLATDLIKLSGLAKEEVPIVFTGLRPGEKLEEALWEPDATVEPTEHPDVLRVREPQSAGDLERAIQDLVNAAHAGDRLNVEATFARWIPTFAPMPNAISLESVSRH